MGPPARGKQGSRIKKEGKGDVYRIGGVDLPWDPELDLDKPKPTPLFPVTRLLNPSFQKKKNFPTDVFSSPSKSPSQSP